MQEGGEETREARNLDGNWEDGAADFKAALFEHHHGGVVDAGACRTHKVTLLNTGPSD